MTNLLGIAFRGSNSSFNKVISTLESMGGTNEWMRTGSDPQKIYYINKNGIIDFVDVKDKNSVSDVYMTKQVFDIDLFLVTNVFNVGEEVCYCGLDYTIDNIFYSKNRQTIVYKIKAFGFGVDYVELDKLCVQDNDGKNDDNATDAINSVTDSETYDVVPVDGTKMTLKCFTDNGVVLIPSNDVKNFISISKKDGTPMIMVNYYDDEYCIQNTIFCSKIEYSYNEID